MGSLLERWCASHGTPVRPPTSAARARRASRYPAPGLRRQSPAGPVGALAGRAGLVLPGSTALLGLPESSGRRPRSGRGATPGP